MGTPYPCHHYHDHHQEPQGGVTTFWECLGNAWENSGVLDPFNLKRSAGIGVRIFMPMLGKLGYDMGYGFDGWGTNEPYGWAHHFIFGMPF